MQMQGQWVALRDQETGQIFYRNGATGESQWEPPQEMSSGTALWSIDGISGVAGFTGVEGFTCTRDGVFTRFTLGGAASRIEQAQHVPMQNEDYHRLEHGRDGRPCQLPYRIGVGDERVLGRFNMVNTKQSVSRGQCTIRCTVDGAAILASDGDQPTLVRQPGGQWEAIYKDQQQFLSEGMQISLDCNDPEGALFVCNSDAGGGGGGGGGGGWVAQVDQASGQTYYMNSQTGETQWEPPQGF